MTNAIGAVAKTAISNKPIVPYATQAFQRPPSGVFRSLPPTCTDAARRRPRPVSSRPRGGAPDGREWVSSSRSNRATLPVGRGHLLTADDYDVFAGIVNERRLPGGGRGEDCPALHLI